MTTAPNAKHVNGALTCMQTTLSLYSSARLNPQEQWHIRKRLESHCITYILTARHACMSLNLSEVLIAVLRVRSPHLALRSLFFILRADQSPVVRKVVRVVKRVGRLNRG